MVYVRRT